MLTATLHASPMRTSATRGACLLPRQHPRSGEDLPLKVRLRGGQDQEEEREETYEGVPLQIEDMDSSMQFVSGSDLEVLDTEAQGVKDISFTPAAQAYLDATLREFMGYADPKPDDDDGVKLITEPDDDDLKRGMDQFSNMLNRHPDRTSLRKGAAPVKVKAPCALADGSVWEYLQAVGDGFDSGNSSEFEEYLENGRASFNRTDTRPDNFNPADEFDDDMARDPASEAAYKLMFPVDDHGESKYRAWRAIMIQSRRDRHHGRQESPPPHTHSQTRRQRRLLLHQKLSHLLVRVTVVQRTARTPRWCTAWGSVTSLRTRRFVYVCSLVCMCVCMYVCMYVCMHACMYVCKHVCLYFCVYVCLYVCMYVYSHTCIPSTLTHEYRHSHIYAYR